MFACAFASAALLILQNDGFASPVERKRVKSRKTYHEIFIETNFRCTDLALFRAGDNGYGSIGTSSERFRVSCSRSQKRPTMRKFHRSATLADCRIDALQMEPDLRGRSVFRSVIWNYNRLLGSVA